MTNYKHTSGPWVADDGDMSDELNWVVAQKSTGAVLAEIVCEASDGTLETWGANARLMAAAPELLAALQRLVNLASHPMMECASVPNYPTRIAEAQAAIAKATKE